MWYNPREVYPRNPFNDRAKEKYLAALKINGLHVKAAEAAGVNYKTAFRHRKDDPEFAELVDEALDYFRDELELETYRRGVQGVTHVIYQRGQAVGEEKRYSDRCLELLLKKNIPEYREKFDINANLSGGVLVVPALAGTTQAWLEANDPDMVPVGHLPPGHPDRKPDEE